MLPIPVAGLCTRSMNQWTAGVVNAFGSANPCLKNNKLNDKLGVVFETEPVTSPVSIQGPINAHLFTSSNSGDGMLSVAVEDVAPDGTVSRLTGGWQVLSHRKLDESRTRYLDGKIIQPYHPFTRADQKRLGRNEVAPIDVEVFPTAATIRPGHKPAAGRAGVRRPPPAALAGPRAGHPHGDEGAHVGAVPVGADAPDRALTGLSRLGRPGG